MKLKVEQKMNKKSNNKINTGYNWYENTIVETDFSPRFCNCRTVAHLTLVVYSV